MTEAEWLACADPGPMVRDLEGQFGARKSRLLVCAFCRHIWDFLHDEASRAAVEVAERYADKQATKRALMAARKAARAVVLHPEGIYWQQRAAHVCLRAVEEKPGIVYGAAVDTSGAVLCNQATQDRYEETKAVQCVFVRDVVGNPFRPVALGPAWKPRDVVGLAQAAYEERSLPGGHLDPARLAVLSDALEDAGCTEAELLAHLRSPGPHVRGCWALDLVLGRS